MTLPNRADAISPADLDGWEPEPEPDEDDEPTPRRKLTRQDVQQGLVDQGREDWIEGRGER